ncbi:MAG TPA: GAF domain-containing protein [Blastocatellia bacterium]|nr:GAF domain-containing protein [Blastocatellia bacterium]
MSQLHTIRRPPAEEHEQNRLRQNERDFHRLFDESPLPMYVYDEESLEFLEVNRATVERYGYSHEEFLRMRITEIRPAAEVARLLAYIAGDRATVELPGHWLHQRRDGKLMEVSLVLLQLKFSGRKATQVIVEDVTEKLALARRQQQLNEELERRLRELTTIYEISRQLQRLREPGALAREVIRLLEEKLGYRYAAVLLLDDTGGRLVPFALSSSYQTLLPEVEAACAEAFDIDLGITGWVARHGESLRVGDVSRDTRYRAICAGIRSELCVPMRAGDGLIGMVNVESPEPDAYTEADERVLETVAAQIGIALQNARYCAELQRHAEELEQRVTERTAELRESNAELEAFAYSVSHDLRTPLRAMKGFSQVLLEDYLPQLDAGARDCLRRVVAGSQRMSELIDALLNLSRITRSTIRSEQVNLSALARNVAEELRKAQPDRRVEFIIADGLLAAGDARLWRVALENLLDNAWKFTSTRDRARIEFGRQQTEQGLAYFVRDDGVGFEMAYADKLFAPFQRLHSTREFPGTGIGLATVQRIVHRHGGRLWAEGEVGKGATIYFTL